MKTALSPLFFNAIKLIVFVLCTLLSFTSFIANADENMETVRKLSESGQILPLEKIIAAAKKIKPGDFLEIELERDKRHYVYEVEMLDDKGQVWELKFNAETGKLIKLERDD